MLYFYVYKANFRCNKIFVPTIEVNFIEKSFLKNCRNLKFTTIEVKFHSRSCLYTLPLYVYIKIGDIGISFVAICCFTKSG